MYIKHLAIYVVFCAGLLSATKAHAIIEITGITNASVFTEPGMPPQEAADGAIDLTAEGNAGPFTFLWSNGATTEDIQNLTSGTYKVTVTNAFGCTKVLQATVKTCDGNSSTVPVITITESTIIPASPFSPLQNDAGINITVTSTLGGSSGELYFKWTNQATHEVVSASEDLVGVTAGTYCVEITGRCATVSKCFTIPPCSYAVPGGAFNLAFTAMPNPCPGQSNGGINLNVTGVPTPLNYQWYKSGQFLGFFANLTDRPSGVYLVKVTDGNGCAYSESYILNNEIIDVNLNSIKHYCSENSKGEISISPIPNGDYQFNWSNGNNNVGIKSDINDLNPGIYTVTIVDPQTSCSKTQSWEIEDGIPSEAVTIESFEHARCNPYLGAEEVCIGNIRLSINEMLVNGQISSSQTYVYSWSGPNSYSLTTFQPEISQLCAGDYTVTITNSKGCTLAKTINICCCDGGNSGTAQNPAFDDNCLDDIESPFNDDPYNFSSLRIDYANIIGPNYSNNFLGSIQLVVKGGVIPRYYNWEKIGDPTFSAHTSLIQNLTSGTYCVTVLDGCQRREGPNAGPLNTACYTLESNIVNLVEFPTCPGGNTGSVQINFVPGQTKPFKITWNGGTKSDVMTDQVTISNLAVGNYIFTITDGNNYTFYIEASIEESGAPSAYDWPLSEVASNKESMFELIHQCLGDGTSKIKWDSYEFHTPLEPVYQWPYNLGIGWPNSSYSTISIFSDGDTDISGPESYTVTEDKMFDFEIFDERSGCRVDFCAVFGRETFIPTEAIINPVRLPLPESESTFSVNAYTGSVCCKQCGSKICPGENNRCLEYTDFSEFKYERKSKINPCSSGGKLIAKCGDIEVEFEIAPTADVIQFVDFSNYTSLGDGDCRYQAGCLFTYPPPLTMFNDNAPLYVTTDIDIPGSLCETVSDDGGDWFTFDFGDYECEDGELTFDIIDPETCYGAVVCEKDGGDEFEFRVLDFLIRPCINNAASGATLDLYCSGAPCSTPPISSEPVEDNELFNLYPSCHLRDCEGKSSGERNGDTPISIDYNYVEIYPVPFFNSFYVELSSSIAGSANVSVIDLLGRVQYSQNIILKEGENWAQMDIGSNLTPGAYILVIDRPDKTKAWGKLIKSSK